MSLRLEFVLMASQEGANIRALCRQFGITPSTAYKWLTRFRYAGKTGLLDLPRTPHHSPLRTGDNTETLILATARKHPVWGARKLKRLLENQGHPMPAASTIHVILQRHALRPHQHQQAPSVGRFEHDAPNQLWQMDFKGHIPCGHGRSHPLTLLDDHSRFCLCVQHCDNEQQDTVQTHLISVFECYGLPERMTMDNGAPWGDTTGVWTALELWLIRQGVRVSHSRPYHPQTQGKLERMHKTLKAELLQGRWFSDKSALQQAFDTWRDTYNLHRPHESLEQVVPASRYHPSLREYVPAPPAPVYPDDMAIRKVDCNGKLSFKGVELKTGKAFRREQVGIREGTEDGNYEVWWYSTIVGMLDLNSRSIIMGKWF